MIQQMMMDLGVVWPGFYEYPLAKRRSRSEEVTEFIVLAAATVENRLRRPACHRRL